MSKRPREIRPEEAEGTELSVTDRSVYQSIPRDELITYDITEVASSTVLEGLFPTFISCIIMKGETLLGGGNVLFMHMPHTHRLLKESWAELTRVAPVKAQILFTEALLFARQFVIDTEREKFLKEKAWDLISDAKVKNAMKSVIEKYDAPRENLAKSKVVEYLLFPDLAVGLAHVSERDDAMPALLLHLDCGAEMDATLPRKVRAVMTLIVTVIRVMVLDVVHNINGPGLRSWLGTMVVQKWRYAEVCAVAHEILREAIRQDNRKVQRLILTAAPKKFQRAVAVEYAKFTVKSPLSMGDWLQREIPPEELSEEAGLAWEKVLDTMNDSEKGAPARFASRAKLREQIADGVARHQEKIDALFHPAHWTLLFDLYEAEFRGEGGGLVNVPPATGDSRAVLSVLSFLFPRGTKPTLIVIPPESYMAWKSVLDGDLYTAGTGDVVARYIVPADSADHIPIQRLRDCIPTMDAAGNVVAAVTRTNVIVTTLDYLLTTTLAGSDADADNAISTLYAQCGRVVLDFADWAAPVIEAKANVRLRRALEAIPVRWALTHWAVSSLHVELERTWLDTMTGNKIIPNAPRPMAIYAPVTTPRRLFTVQMNTHDLDVHEYDLYERLFAYAVAVESGLRHDPPEVGLVASLLPSTETQRTKEYAQREMASLKLLQALDWMRQILIAITLVDQQLLENLIQERKRLSNKDKGKPPAKKRARRRSYFQSTILPIFGTGIADYVVGSEDNAVLLYMSAPDLAKHEPGDMIRKSEGTFFYMADVVSSRIRLMQSLVMRALATVNPMRIVIVSSYSAALDRAKAVIDEVKETHPVRRESIAIDTFRRQPDRGRLDEIARLNRKGKAHEIYFIRYDAMAAGSQIPDVDILMELNAPLNAILLEMARSRVMVPRSEGPLQIHTFATRGTFEEPSTLARIWSHFGRPRPARDPSGSDMESVVKKFPVGLGYTYIPYDVFTATSRAQEMAAMTPRGDALNLRQVWDLLSLEEI